MHLAFQRLPRSKALAKKKKNLSEPTVHLAVSQQSVRYVPRLTQIWVKNSNIQDCDFGPLSLYLCILLSHSALLPFGLCTRKVLWACSFCLYGISNSRGMHTSAPSWTGAGQQRCVMVIATLSAGNTVRLQLFRISFAVAVDVKLSKVSAEQKITDKVTQQLALRP